MVEILEYIITFSLGVYGIYLIVSTILQSKTLTNTRLLFYVACIVILLVIVVINTAITIFTLYVKYLL